MNDRTTRFLLAVIALGLWGLLLRPLFSSTPVQAAPPASAPAFPAMLEQGNSSYFYVVEDRTLYALEGYGGDVKIVKRLPLR